MGVERRKGVAKGLDISRRSVYWFRRAMHSVRGLGWLSSSLSRLRPRLPGVVASTAEEEKPHV